MLYGENMKTLCLLNHKLTLNQIADLEQNWHSKEIVYPPEEIALMCFALVAAETVILIPLFKFSFDTP